MRDESLANSRLVVGDDDAQGYLGVAHCGTCAVTIQWPSRAKTVSVPFNNKRRSRMAGEAVATVDTRDRGGGVRFGRQLFAVDDERYPHERRSRVRRQLVGVRRAWRRDECFLRRTSKGQRHVGSEWALFSGDMKRHRCVVASLMRLGEFAETGREAALVSLRSACTARRVSLSPSLARRWA